MLNIYRAFLLVLITGSICVAFNTQQRWLTFVCGAVFASAMILLFMKAIASLVDYCLDQLIFIR